MDKIFSVEYMLRFAVALAFIYPPLSALANPLAWVGYFPPFLFSLPVDQMVLLHMFGALEVVLALWILFGKRVALPSTIAAFVLIMIVLFNFSQLDVLFRDISVALAALALAYLSRDKQNRNTPVETPSA